MSEDVTPKSEIAPGVDPVAEKLAEFGVDAAIIDNVKTELGVTAIEDLTVLTIEDFLGVGIKPVQARKLVAEFSPVAAAAETAALSSAAEGILPKPLDDASWLETIKATGILKVGEATYTSAIRAALASRVGMFDIPKRIVKAMDEFSQVTEEPFTPEYYALKDQITKTNYGEIFAAIPGVNGSYVTETRKKELLRRVDDHLWPAISNFYGQLASWQEKWLQTSLNPAMLPMLLLGGGKALSPGAIQAPDTSTIRDYAEEVVAAINKVFAGDGVTIASALAYEASSIKKSLEDPSLPAMIGAPNRELMLKQLGVAVGPTDPRLEKNLTTFVLATLKLKDQPAGETELQYLGALFQLGSEIPWDQLTGRGRMTTIGNGRGHDL